MSARTATCNPRSTSALRQQPRFAEFAARAGLLDYWKQYGMPDDCRLLEGRLRCGFATVAAAGPSR